MRRPGNDYGNLTGNSGAVLSAAGDPVVMAFFQVFFAVGGIAFQLLAGFLGQYLPFRPLAFGLGMFSMISMAALIFVPKNQNRPVFEAVREEPK